MYEGFSRSFFWQKMAQGLGMFDDFRPQGLKCEEKDDMQKRKKTPR